MRDKDKKIASLEGKIADLEEEKLQQYNQYLDELAAQKNLLELQAVDLKKRVQELTEKCEGYKIQVAQASQQNKVVAATSANEKQMQAQIKQLQDELMAKEEENYNTIVNLKEENTKLLK